MSGARGKKVEQHGGAGLCPLFHQAVELIGKRWTGAIVRVLTSKPARFVELREKVPELSDRLLSERLKELEDVGIVERVVAGDRPIAVSYRLTDKGRALEPALDAIGKWAVEWLR